MRYRLMGCLLASVMAGCGGGGDSASTPPPSAPVSTAALSGVINIEASSRIDNDTADGLVQLGQSLSNNDAPFAQQLPSDVLAAGYVSGSGGLYPDAGTQVGFGYAQDTVDVFKVSLQPGQKLTLQTVQTRAGNALAATQLRLSNPANPSVSLDNDFTAPTNDPTTSVDSVSVILPLTEAAGEYFVSVSSPVPGADPVRYVLSTSVSSTALASSLTWPDFPYVTGQAMVRMAAPVANAASALSAMSADARPLGGNDWLVQMPQAFFQAADQQADTLQWIERLRQTAGVIAAVPNYQVRALALPTTEPLFSKQWHYGLINAPTAWQIEPTGGAGVKVAVLDTGLLKDVGGNWHPDLAANVINSIPPGADFVSAAFDNDGTGGRDSDPADPGNLVGSSVFHGTHVAGTVAAAVNDLGVTGVAYGATLLPVRVLGEGGAGSSADLLDAINWVASTPLKADIVNMSLGGLPFIQSLQDAINQAAGKGVLFAAAAGNENTNALSYPAAFSNVLAVAAVDGGAKRASYSNFGSWISLAAPGGDASRDANADGLADLVISTGVDGQSQPGFTGLQGTSMASPHVAGVLALMKAVKADLTQAEVEGFLANGDLTDDLGDPNLGKGLINASKAVVAASSGTTPKILSPSPASLNFVGSTNSLALALQVLGGASITLDSVTGPAWASVVPTLPISSSTSINVTVTIDPLQLTSGQLFQSNLTLNYTDNTATAKTLDVPLIAQLFSDEQLRNAGRHFVILVNPEPNANGFFTAAAQTVVQVSNGQYAFSFTADDGVAPQALDEVPPGAYFLVAGSDLDNDGILCQPGEACAEFPVAGLRQQIDIVAGTFITGIELTTSYNRPVISAATANMLPRPGFKGYRLLQLDTTSPTRSIKTP